MQKKNKEENSNEFWKINKNANISILQYDLINFIISNGYAKVETDNGIIIVKRKCNIIREVKSDHELVDLVTNYLKDKGEYQVLECFARGVSSYLAKKKLELLPTIPFQSDRDKKDEIWFYFKNVAVKVTGAKLECINYEDLPSAIWDTSIIQREFFDKVPGKSDFETFVWNIADKDPERFKALKSILGFLMHRYNDPGNKKAVIFIDKILSSNGRTNGGTGKSLLLQALGKLRNVVVMDGKSIKKGSWFKNQRIERNTDIIFYDDVTENFDFEELYSMITGDIVVEKKRQQEFTIKAEDAPKISISSNYIVRGPGGSSDVRRRCEYEVSDHYHANHQPIDDFGKLFFDGWDDKEWFGFDTFMVECAQTYLQKGLITPSPINLEGNRLISATSPEFVEYVKSEIKLNIWNDKRETLDNFKMKYPELHEITSNLFTKWLKEYAAHKNFEYQDRSSGGKYSFILKTVKKVGDEE